MAKDTQLAARSEKRRGRPPLPGGPKSQAEIQRAYRARLKAAANPPGFDPDKQMICDRDVFTETRDRLHNVMLKLELREQDVGRLQERNAYLEAELKLQAQHHTNALKDNIMLKQLLAQKEQKPKRRQRKPA